MAALAKEAVFPMPKFIFSWEEADDACPDCGRRLYLRLTRRRKVVSLAYGSFLALERQGFCPAHPERAPVRSRQLPRIVAAGANLAHDVVVRVGLARFLECRQFEEIQAELSRQYGVVVPQRTFSYLAQRFVAYLQVVHEQSISLLRKDMRKRGGYVLHIDGTCEEASHVLLVCLDSLSGQILDSRKIASENTADVKDVLKNVRQQWGVPLAIVHDLRQSLITAAAEVFEGVAQFVCHYHLAADVGKDILSPDVDRLRRLFRRTKVRPKLRELRRSLKKFAVSEDSAEHVVRTVLDCRSPQRLQQYATEEMLKGTVHALASWILAFSRTGEGYGYPFDLPYLALYERIVEVHKVLEKASAAWPRKTAGAMGTLKRLKTVLEAALSSEHTEELRQIVADTMRDLRIFQRFRTALRICPNGGKRRRNDEGAPDTLSPGRHKLLLKKLRAALRRKARQSPAAARACNIIVEHLDKYWPLLFGHSVKRRPRIVVPRTNNVEERLF
ncbi:MAG: hypothetical protein ACE5FA_11515, partial [Dehalococcoidia bacterium]